VRRSLVIVCLLGTIGSSVHAGDLLPLRFLNPRASSVRRHPSTFPLKLVVGSGEDLVNFVPSMTAGKQDAGAGVSSGGHARIQDPDVFTDEPGDENLPPLTSVPQSPQGKAIPLNDTLRDEAESDADEEERIPTRRSSFGWIAGSQNNLGMFELNLEPLSRLRYDAFGSSQKDALVTSETLTLRADTTVGARWLNGPDTPDLPPYLFNILINVDTTYRVSDRFAINGLISPGWYTDFSNKGAEAFRLPWHVVSYTKANDDWQWVLGITDLAREDIRLLPVAGFIYAPGSGDVRWDLVFPKPRVAWRVSRQDEFKRGALTIKKHEGWLYLAGELGGGSWAISRSDRSYDVVTYRDYRLVAGWENRQGDGSASRIEVGWIFDRAVQYQSNVGNYNPPDSLMIRVSTDY